MPPMKQLDLHIDIDVLTSGSTAEIVNSILEILLYQRNQIPFVYNTYRYYVNKWQEQEEIPLSIRGMQSFLVQRKKQEATATKEAISSMRQAIKNIFEKKLIKSIRFLFGSTIFTAKEAYTVHIPTENIAQNHFYEHHRISADKLNRTLLSLLTNEDLYSIFSHNLNTTNIYLEVELLENENLDAICKDPLQKSDIFPKEMFSLPASCKEIHIYLLHKQIDTTSKQQACCKTLQVFEDLTSEGLADNAKELNEKRLSSLTTGWWEAEIVVRGFKDRQIKGYNIWS